MINKQSGTLTPVCLNWGKQLYLLPSNEEVYYSGILWVDYSGHGAMTQCWRIDVIIYDVDPQLRQRLVLAECSTERCKERSPVFNN